MNEDVTKNLKLVVIDTTKVRDLLRTKMDLGSQKIKRGRKYKTTKGATHRPCSFSKVVKKPDWRTHRQQKNPVPRPAPTHTLDLLQEQYYSFLVEENKKRQKGWAREMANISNHKSYTPMEYLELLTKAAPAGISHNAVVDTFCFAFDMTFDDVTNARKKRKRESENNLQNERQTQRTQHIGNNLGLTCDLNQSILLQSDLHQSILLQEQQQFLQLQQIQILQQQQQQQQQQLSSCHFSVPQQTSTINVLAAAARTATNNHHQQKLRSDHIDVQVIQQNKEMNRTLQTKSVLDTLDEVSLAVSHADAVDDDDEDDSISSSICMNALAPYRNYTTLAVAADNQQCSRSDQRDFKVIQ